jgi:HAD superfamily hydrolase (TIGR01509 family)
MPPPDPRARLDNPPAPPHNATTQGKRAPRMIPLYDAVVFDLDGTLIDTESLCNDAGIDACADLGFDVSLAFFQSLAGIHDAERVRLISAHLGRPLQMAPFYAAWDDHVRRRMATGVPIKPGAVDLLSTLHGRGLPLALATSSRAGPAAEKLAAAGLDRWFSAVVTVDDVVAAKPAPDAYLLAAARLGANPARAVAFEDSDTGARAAHAAGLTVVQVPDIHPTAGLHAHHVAPSLLDGARAVGLI